MGEGEGRGLRLVGYTSINGRLPFYGQGEASDGKIQNFQYHFWRMLRPYDFHVDTLAGPPPDLPHFQERKWGRGRCDWRWMGTQVLSADYRFTVRAKHPTTKF